MRSSDSRYLLSAAIALTMLVVGLGGAEQASSADLPGMRSAPLGATIRQVCKSGCTWSTISAAVKASSSGDEIHVAQGTYNEAVEVRNKSLTILGGYSPTWNRNPAVYVTIIDGVSGKPAVRLASDNGNNTGKVDGFTVTGANNSAGQGGGLYVSGYRATISNNRIHHNHAQYGGGISVRNATGVILEDNVLEYNTSAVDGGGIRVEGSTVSILDNNVQHNTSGYGGGISVRDTAATIDGNTVALNVASNGGGGMQFILGSTGLISNNQLVENQAGANPGGGGIHFYQCAPQYGGTPQFVGNTVTDNTAGNAGGGMNIEDSSPLVQDNVITNNHAGDHGGGVSVIVDSAPTIVDNLVAENSASVKAGGVWSYASSPLIRRNEIVDNQAPTAGGIHLTGSVGFEITNNVIARNKATIEGGGIHLTSNSRGNIINNSLVNNNLGAGGEAINCRNTSRPTIANNILVGHKYGVRVKDQAAPTVEYNDAWDNNTNYEGVGGNPGHISCDPQFVNRVGGDYHLRAGSCVIDNGTQSGAPSSDFDGDARPLDGDGDGNPGWDRGADEYFNQIWVTKDVDNQVLDPGDPVSFTIVYRNNSASTVTGVVISDPLSAHLTNADYSFTGPNLSLRDNTRYVWDVPGGLAPGAEGTITITARVDPGVDTPKAIANKVTFQMNGYGPFEDEVLIIVGGLTTHAPAVLNDCAQ